MARRDVARIVWHASIFSIYDTFLYFNSLNHYLEHIRKSNYPLTEPHSESERIYLALIVAGAALTFFANIPAYYVSIKSAETKTRPEDNRLQFSRLPNILLMGVTLGGILFKVIAPSSSFQALLHDKITAPPSFLKVLFQDHLQDHRVSQGVQAAGFSLAFLGHLFAQTSVLMRSMGWRANFRNNRFNNFLIKFGITWYNITLQIMYWNAMNLDALEFNWISKRISISNILHDPVKMGLAAGGAGLLTVAAVRTQKAYVKLSKLRFIAGDDEQKSPSLTDKVTGFITASQRTLWMYLAVAVVIHMVEPNPILALLVSLLGFYSLYKCNHSIVYPYQPRQRLDAEELLLSDFDGAFLTTGQASDERGTGGSINISSFEPFSSFAPRNA